MPKLAVIAWLFAGWGLCATQPATACRYNVRDTGFVDLGASYYGFAWTDPLSAPANLLSEPDAGKFTPSDSLRESLRDTNLLFLQNPTTQKTPPDATSQPPADDENPAVNITITAPDGRELSLPCPGDADSLAMVAQLVDSPLQRELIDRLLNCHSVVLLIEGVDEAENKAARDLIEQTLEETQKASALWPKPIDHPPEMVLLPQSEKNEERLLLWCLEVDADVPDPQFVVLFGRGRKLGPVLTLDEVRAGELSGLLSVVSMDCECEYNVAPLVGPMIPHRWTTEQEAQVARLLDFDPGNPLVQSEVQHILTRGPGNGRSILEAQTAPALGYEEISFPDDLISTPEAENPTNDSETGLATETGGTTIAMTTTKPPESPVTSPPTESPSATPATHSLDDGNETIATTPLQNGIWLAVVMVAVVAIIGSVVILRSATR